MSWEVVPPHEMPKVTDAAKNGDCVSCYKPAGDNGLYCIKCDPPDSDASGAVGSDA